MICHSCGAQLADDSAFCTSCGAPTGAYRQPAPAPMHGCQQPTQPAMYPQGTFTQTPPAAVKVPWHSRGRLSPLYPGHKRVTVLFTAALVALQVILLFIISAVEETIEADMLTAQIVGFIPTAVLIVYLFCLDSIEKEPIGLLLKLFFVEGAVACIAVAYIEMGFETAALLVLDEDSFLFRVVDNLICVALVEELVKYTVLKRFTWNHPSFNYSFDGIVYAAVTSLGFAAFENASYVAEYGITTALGRMVTAVPSHCVDGILMGFFYGKAKLLECRGNHSRARRSCLLALLAPIAEHGFYDFFATRGESDLAFYALYAYILILNAVVFVLVWRLAQKDEAICQPQMHCGGAW